MRCSLSNRSKKSLNMRWNLIVTTILTGLVLTACSQQDQDQIKDEAKSAGAEVKATTKDILSDPKVQEAGAAVKSVGAKAAGVIKDGAAEAEAGLSSSADEDRTEARSGEAETE